MFLPKPATVPFSPTKFLLASGPLGRGNGLTSGWSTGASSGSSINPMSLAKISASKSGWGIMLSGFVTSICLIKAPSRPSPYLLIAPKNTWIRSIPAMQWAAVRIHLGLMSWVAKKYFTNLNWFLVRHMWSSLWRHRRNFIMKKNYPSGTPIDRRCITVTFFLLNTHRSTAKMNGVVIIQVQINLERKLTKVGWHSVRNFPIIVTTSISWEQFVDYLLIEWRVQWAFDVLPLCRVTSQNHQT